MTERTELRLIEGETVGNPAGTGHANDPHEVPGDPVPVSPDPFLAWADERLAQMEETDRKLLRMLERIRGA